MCLVGDSGTKCASKQQIQTQECPVSIVMRRRCEVLGGLAVAAASTTLSAQSAVGPKCWRPRCVSLFNEDSWRILAVVLLGLAACGREEPAGRELSASEEALLGTWELVNDSGVEGTVRLTFRCFHLDKRRL